jgi:hypothetical protein
MPPAVGALFPWIVLSRNVAVVFHSLRPPPDPTHPATLPPTTLFPITNVRVSSTIVDGVPAGDSAQMPPPPA